MYPAIYTYICLLGASSIVQDGTINIITTICMIRGRYMSIIHSVVYNENVLTMLGHVAVMTDCRSINVLCEWRARLCEFVCLFVIAVIRFGADAACAVV